MTVGRTVCPLVKPIQILILDLSVKISGFLNKIACHQGSRRPVVSELPEQMATVTFSLEVELSGKGWDFIRVWLVKLNGVGVVVDQLQMLVKQKTLNHEDLQLNQKLSQTTYKE